MFSQDTLPKYLVSNHIHYGYSRNFAESTDFSQFTGISRQDYQSGWKKAKETKSSGGVTIHFGHCKAMAQDDNLSEMESAFLSIPLRSGYPYQYWHKGVDCTLLKKANSYRVDKLRTIELFEADFNFINKAVSRKLARMAEKTKSLAIEQYGSRKNHRSIEHVLNK